MRSRARTTSSEAHPFCDSPEDPSPGRVALGQRAGNKGWGARPPPRRPATRPRESDPSQRPRLISNTKPGVGGLFHPERDRRTRSRGPRRGMGWWSREPHRPQIRRREIGRSRLVCPRAPVPAARPQVTRSPKKPSPYPPATDVGAPRAARAARSHCQLRAVETGVDSEEEGTELQPRGHGRALAQRGPSPLDCRLQLALSPEWAVAAVAAGGPSTPSMRNPASPRVSPPGPALFVLVLPL